MENEKPFKLVFEGELTPGISRETVQENLRSQLKLSEKVIAGLFNAQGAAVTVKRFDDKLKAEKFRSNFIKLGLILKLAEDKPKSELTLQAIEPSKTAESVDTLSAAEPMEQVEDLPVSAFKKIIWRIQADLAAILLALSGLFFLIYYSPVPDGFLRKGFILGLLLLFFGYRKYRVS